MATNNVSSWDNFSNNVGAGMSAYDLHHAFGSNYGDWESDYFSYLQNLDYLKREQQYNKEMFDYANEYNTPLNQVARLKEAGFNPAMAGSSPSAGGSSSAPSSPSVSASAHGGINETTELVQLLDAVNQSQMTSANIANLNADTLNKSLESQRRTVDNYVNEVTAGNRVSLSGLSVQNLSLQNESIVSQIAEIEANTDKIIADISLSNTQALLNVSNSEMNEFQKSLQAAMFDFKKQIDSGYLTQEEQRVAVAVAQYQLNKLMNSSQISVNKKLKKVYQAQVEQLGALAKKLGVETEHEDILKDLDDTYGGAQRVMGMVNGTINAVGNAIGNIWPKGKGKVGKDGVPLPADQQGQGLNEDEINNIVTERVRTRVNEMKETQDYKDFLRHKHGLKGGSTSYQGTYTKKGTSKFDFRENQRMRRNQRMKR